MGCFGLKLKGSPKIHQCEKINALLAGVFSFALNA